MLTKLTVLRLLTFSSREVETPGPGWSPSTSAAESREYSTLLFLERHFPILLKRLPSTSIELVSLQIATILSWLLSSIDNLKLDACFLTSGNKKVVTITNFEHMY